MKIGLEVTPALAGHSGMRFYIEEIIAGLAAVDRENEYSIYSVFWKDRERLDSLKLPKRPNFHVVFKKFPQRFLFPLEELGLRLQERWLRGMGLDVFHGLGHLLPPLRTIPSVVTLHHVGGISDRATLWDRFYLGFVTQHSLRRADAVIAVSEYTRQQALKTWKLDPDRVITVLEGGPSTRLRPKEEKAPSEAPPVRSYPYILHVGSFLEHKNIGLLVKAFHRWLSQAAGRPERLILAGHPGRGLEPVKALIGELKLGERVEIMTRAGPEEILALYQNASVVAVPSRLEGFGFPVLEAMACGAPVLASNATSLPEIAGGAALLFDPDDAEGLAQALNKVLTEPDTADDLRRRGLARVRQFSWEEAARRTLDVYRRVARGKGM